MRLFPLGPSERNNSFENAAKVQTILDIVQMPQRPSKTAVYSLKKATTVIEEISPWQQTPEEQ